MNTDPVLMVGLLHDFWLIISFYPHFENLTLTGLMRCSTANANLLKSLPRSQTPFVGEVQRWTLFRAPDIYHLDIAGPALWLRGPVAPYSLPDQVPT